MIAILAALQLAALVLLVARLAPGRHRRPPVDPDEPATRALDRGATPGDVCPRVTVLVPTRNEAHRIGPCLAGLEGQGAPLAEVIVVDSHSTDETQALVAGVAQRDPRFRVVEDPPLPAGWVGKVWALQHGLRFASGDWILGIDADTEPRPGMVAAVVRAAERHGYDVVSFSPTFADMRVSEQWLQPSMLLTLVYRVGAAGERNPAPSRVMANGQCFLARRDILLANGGYEAARGSWADDVTLARALAARGARVGFLDGSRLYKVRAYDGIAQMWREWGRSFDLSDACTRAQQWFDVAFIAVAQGTPLLVLLGYALGALSMQHAAPRLLVMTSAALLTIRVLMLLALAGSYERRSVGFWLSPLSDPLAALRLVLSTVRRPRAWRGRQFALGAAGHG